MYNNNSNNNILLATIWNIVSKENAKYKILCRRKEKLNTYKMDLTSKSLQTHFCQSVHTPKKRDSIDRKKKRKKGQPLARIAR